MPKVVPDYKVQAKARIAQAGLSVFAKKGYRRTTMEDIAREVGVSKGDLYLYFDSKVDILREVQAAGQRDMRGRLQELAGRPDWSEGILELIDEVVEEAKGGAGLWASYFELMAEGIADPAVGKVLRADNLEDRRIMADLLRSLPAGRKPRSEPELEELALIFSMAIFGSVLELSLGIPWPDIRRALRRTLEAVVAR
jgi:AcrR family transcriptional regulator